jgi:hypothetical protein
MDVTVLSATKDGSPARAVLRKQGSLGGEQEAGFEQAFSSLAYAYLKDKAPRLIDHIVGFQLVDRNEDNTKAVGVFGFQLGDQWLYAPVFFLNGDLKGHELLYVKKQDMFVPMKENWVNYLMSKKPHILGEGSPQTSHQLGGLSPNIEQLSWPPEQSKFSEDRFHATVKEALDRGPHYVEDWAKPVMSMFGACKTANARFLYRDLQKGRGMDMAKVAAAPWKAALTGINLDLSGLLSENLHILKKAYELTQTYPQVKKAFDAFYGEGIFHKLGCVIRDSLRADRTNIMPRESVKKAAARAEKFIIAEEKKAAGPAVKVITRDEVATVQNMPELTEEEREKLLNDGLLIVDRREGEEVSKAYNTQVAGQTLTNVQETGLYDVLEKPGTFKEHLVLSHPYSNRGQEPGVTTIRLGDGDKAWKNTVRQALWHRHAGLREDFQKWFDALGDGPDSLKKGGTYVLVNERGQATVPFEVTQNYGDKSYKVNFNCDFDEGPRRPGDTSHTFYKDFNNHDGGYVSSWGAMLHFTTKPGSELRAMSGELHVPDDGFKVFRVKAPKKPKKNECCNSIMNGPVGSDDDYDVHGSDPSPINPGDIVDIQQHLVHKTARMKLYSDHNEIYVSTEKTGTDRYSPMKAMIALVRNHGLGEGQARELVKQAQYKGQQTFRVKYAVGFPYQTTGMGPNAPAFPEPERGTEQHGYNSSAAIYPQEEFTQVEGLQSDRTDPRIYDPHMMPDPNTMQMAQEAGESGQKEVFDVGMISGLLKAVRQDSLVDRYLGDLMKALDRLGRMIFLFFWHQEEFEDRYGKADLPELEDSLRNAFETLGDVTLFLKEKTIDPGQDQLGDPDIEEAARN